MASGNPTSTCIPRVEGKSTDPRGSGHHTNGQGQSATTRGSSCDDFKMLGPPYISGTSDPTKAEAWITKIETFFFCH